MREKIKEAFKTGNLKILSVSPEGLAEKKKITHIHRFKNEDVLYKVTTSEGEFIATGGHKIFLTPTTKKMTEDLVVGDMLLSLEGHVPVLSIEKTPHEEYVYDLTVEDNHNFMLENSRAVVSNSPDRNYNFAPPEQESEIGKYNRVFGYLFEDYEIITFLQMALEQWNGYPPETEYISSLNILCQSKPTWSTFIVWGAVVHAMFALSVNWVRNEFDYSIGGVSLSLDRSSKYESMKSSAEAQFDKQIESKMMTVKVIRGLRQPRFSGGVRSAFGANTAPGVLSPRSFVA